MLLMVLKSNGMPLSNLKRNRDAIPPHIQPWLQDIYLALYTFKSTLL
jgi:hypothetical protein